jgi:hypothetical protein
MFSEKWLEQAVYAMNSLAALKSKKFSASIAGRPSQPPSKVFRKALYLEHPFLEMPSSAVVGFLSPRFRWVFGTAPMRQTNSSNAMPAPRMSANRERPEVRDAVVKVKRTTPSETFSAVALDKAPHLDDHVRPTGLGLHHGPQKLAAEPWPRKI